MQPADKTNQDSLAGVLLALTVYGIWGFLPLYLKYLSHIPAPEIVVHRVLWSVPIALAMVAVARNWKALWGALRNPQMLVVATVCALLISFNWGIYIWAIAAGHALEGALGYYINPLFSVLIGRVLLNERLVPLQWLALALAAVAVVVLTVALGRLPFVAFGLTLTWAIYAFLKKSVPMGANEGFALEVLILTPFAIGYLIWLSLHGESHFFDSTSNILLLIGSGVATAVPLIIYGNAAKRLRLSTIAMMQYLSPTMIFLIAVFVFKEPFGTQQAIAFPLIWLGLILFTIGGLRKR